MPRKREKFLTGLAAVKQTIATDRPLRLSVWSSFSLAARLTQALPTPLSPHIIHDQRPCKLASIVRRQLIGYTAQEVISR
jgi:hypothetical protein